MKIEINKNITQLNSFGLNAHCKEFVEITTEEEAVHFYQKRGDEKSMVLGGGSNVLFTSDYDGTIVANKILGRHKVRETDDSVWVRIGAGENWHDVVRYCISNNWGGIENLSLIPGNAGAAPIQNIGAYGVEIKDVLESVSCLLIPELTMEVFDNAGCQFGYRNSIFKTVLKGQIFITYLVLKLTKRHQLHTSYGAIKDELSTIEEKDWTIENVSDAVIKIRQSKLPDPKILGNAGSFFKNPVVTRKVYENLVLKYPDMPGYTLEGGDIKLAAGWLIEKCGWKGKQIGRTGCHAKQALVLVNYGNATGQEIVEHAHRVMGSVEENFGIHLEPEVNII